MKERELWLVEPTGNRNYPLEYETMFCPGGIQENEWYRIERGWNCAAPQWKKGSISKRLILTVKRVMGC